MHGWITLRLRDQSFGRSLCSWGVKELQVSLGTQVGTLWPKHLAQQISPLLLAGSGRYWKDWTWLIKSLSLPWHSWC